MKKLALLQRCSCLSKEHVTFLPSCDQVRPETPVVMKFCYKRNLQPLLQCILEKARIYGITNGDCLGANLVKLRLEITTNIIISPFNERRVIALPHLHTLLDQLRCVIHHAPRLRHVFNAPKLITDTHLKSMPYCASADCPF